MSIAKGVKVGEKLTSDSLAERDGCRDGKSDELDTSEHLEQTGDDEANSQSE